MNDEGLSGSHDTEALVLAIETPCGEIYLNIAMRHLARVAPNATPHRSLADFSLTIVVANCSRHQRRRRIE